MLKAKQREIARKRTVFERRRKRLEKRSDDAVSEEEINQIEEDVATLEEEIADFEDSLDATEEDLQDQIDDILDELEALEDALDIDPEEDLDITEGSEERNRSRMRQARGIQSFHNMDNRTMRRTKVWGAMTRSQVDTFVKDERTKAFLDQVRSLGAQKRSVKGAELTIPDNVLEILKDTTNRYSKLIKHVNLRPIKGTARQTIAPNVTEAIWTEMCATLNELTIMFNQVEVDGYKVGGYVVICNATLADSDINMAEEILDALGQAIGYAVDKAIIYGKGKKSKMPLGYITRLAQTTEPEDWNKNAPEWKDLHLTHITKASTGNLTDTKLYQEFVLATGEAKSNYSNNEKVWVMNEKTWTTLQSKLLSFTATGALVSGMGDDMKMPVIGGIIETLDFIPDGDISGGYMSNYILAEREGANFAQSEHVMFIQDNTVFKGTARYDGLPVFGDSFVAFNINGTPVTTEVAFAPDKANEESETETP